MIQTKKKPTILILLISTILVVTVVVVYIVKTGPDRRVEQPTAELRSAEKSGMRIDGSLQFKDNAGTTLSTIGIEIAETEATRMQGLMGRSRIAEAEGMLFIFEGEEERSFWMVNTPLSLDIIFLDAQLKIVSIQKNATPYSEESLPSHAPARFVVEVNGGFCERHGITVGQSVTWKKQ